VAFSADSQLVITGNEDSFARLWDAATGAPSGKPLPHPGGVTAVALGPNARTALTGCEDGIARLWDLSAPEPRVMVLLPHLGGVTSVAFSPVGKVVLTGSKDNSGRLWDMASGKPIGMPAQHQGAVTGAVFTPDGRSIVTGSRDATVRFWSVSDPLEGSLERIALWVQAGTGMELRPDEGARLLDVATWQQRRQRLRELGGPPIPE